MSAQRGERCPGGGVPDPGARVVACRHQPASVGAEGNAAHRRAMALQGRDQAKCIGSPESGCGVAAGSHDASPVRAEGGIKDCLGVAAQLGQFLADWQSLKSTRSLKGAPSRVVTGRHHAALFMLPQPQIPERYCASITIGLVRYQTSMVLTATIRALNRPAFLLGAGRLQIARQRLDLCGRH